MGVPAGKNGRGNGLRWQVAAAILSASALAGCNYAPLPSAAGSATAASVAPRAVGSDAALPDIDGQVCCVAADPTSVTAVDGISVSYNGWDTAFISWMVPHFAVASQLAELAPSRSGTAQVRTLAAKIDAVMSPNYLKMAAMAKAWGQPVPSTDPSAASGHDHGGDDSSGADLAAGLTKLSGVAFDRKYLQVVLADDRAALANAQATVANCVNPQAKILAQQLVTDNAAQIAQAQRLLAQVS